MNSIKNLKVIQRKRAMKEKQIVSQDSHVMHGTLVFAGTRVPVESLIQHLVAGDSLDIFLDDFPTVSREQAVACLQSLSASRTSDSSSGCHIENS